MGLNLVGFVWLGVFIHLFSISKFSSGKVLGRLDFTVDARLPTDLATQVDSALPGSFTDFVLLSWSTWPG